MRPFTLFSNLVKVNIKRLTKYVPSILASVCILFVLCGTAGYFVSKYIYKDDGGNKSTIAYYLPDDADRGNNLLFLNILQQTESMNEIVELIQITDKDQGFAMLDKGEILFFIVVPDNFFSGVMDSTNTPLDIYMPSTETVTSYATNELFYNYATYLGISQAGIYSMLDTLRDAGYDDSFVDSYDIRINLMYMDHALNKDGYIEEIDATKEHGVSLLSHFLAVAVLLVLLMISVVLMPYLQGYTKGMYKQFAAYSCPKIYVFLSNYIATILGLYLAFLPCYVGLSIYNKAIHPLGLLQVIPVILVVALFINLAANFSKNNFTGNMIVFVCTLVLLYVGGGFLPTALLPNAVRSLSQVLPGEWMIKTITTSVFGAI